MRNTINQKLQTLLREQERLDELRPVAVRRFGPRLCDLAYANPYDGTPQVVLDVIHKSLESTRELSFQYTPYGGATLTRRVVAQKLMEQTGVPFHWRDVVMTPGAMAALNLIFRALIREGVTNEVIVIVPCWLDYPLYLENLGIRMVPVTVDPDTLRLDLQKIEDNLTNDTRAVIFSQPANPSGVVYHEQELKSLGELLEAKAPETLLISDEAHRDFAIDPPLPASYYANTCVIYSFGKRLMMQGQRIGYVAISSNAPARETLRQTLIRLARIMGFCTPTTLMQIAIRELVSTHLDFSHIFTRRQELATALRSGGYNVPESDATFFIYPRTPVEDDFEFVSLLADVGVLALPATVFHSIGRFRLSVTADEEHLIEAAARMNTLLKGLSGGSAECE